jgi:hypothetical protein
VLVALIFLRRALMSDNAFRITTRRSGNNRVIIYLPYDKFRRYFENFPFHRSSIAARSDFRQSRVISLEFFLKKKVHLARSDKTSERSEARAMN